MPALVQSDFLGRRIDLLGQATGITWNAAAIGAFFPIFTTNNSQWPSARQKTVVQYVTVDAPSSLPGTVGVAVGVLPSLDWCLSAQGVGSAPVPVTLYMGQQLAGANLPGAYGNGVAFGVNLQGWSTGQTVSGIILAAYGWVE